MLLCSESSQFTQLDHEKGYIEYDAFSLIYTLRSLINSLYTTHKLKAHLIESITLITQEQFFLLWDKDTGSPLTPIISRDCMRAKEERLFFIQNHVTEIIKTHSGFCVEPQSPGLKLKCLMDSDPELKSRVSKGRFCMVVLIPGFCII